MFLARKCAGPDSPGGDAMLAPKIILTHRLRSVAWPGPNLDIHQVMSVRKLEPPAPVALLSTKQTG